MGSSPLTRGKPHPMARQPCRRRLIPAHAGKTRCERPSAYPWRAHPRSRGENRRRDGGDLVGRGSSPLTRGKRRGGSSYRNSAGLIPAHAGKTPRVSAQHLTGPAHPRSRGENDGARASDTLERGSSPLTRGKRVGAAADAPGLIPAHAGKTFRFFFWGWLLWAHPRSRGENLQLHYVG